MCPETRTAVIRCLIATVVAASIAVPAPAQTLAGGDYHVLVVKPDGTVWSFGWNAYGPLGDGTETARSAPVQVSGLSDIVAVAAGERHSLAITSTGSLYVWGYNASGQVGDGTTTNRTSPVQSTLTNVVAIAGGRTHSLALQSDGDVYAFGGNAYGQLGTGNTDLI